MKGTVRCVSWCPNSAIALVAAAVDNNVYLINPGVGDRLVQAKTDEILKEMPAQTDYLSRIIVVSIDRISCFNKVVSF